MKPIHVVGMGLWAPGFANVTAWREGRSDPRTIKPACSLIDARLKRGTSLFANMLGEVVEQAAKDAELDLRTVATVYGSSNTASMDALAEAVLEGVAGAAAEPDRPGRNSDQGFYGIGLPLLQFDHSRTDPGGRYWFWHTEEDTFDKIDFEVLASDTRLYLPALSRLLTSPIPPIRLSAETSELKARLLERKASAASQAVIKSGVVRWARHTSTFSRTARSRVSRSALHPGSFVCKEAFTLVAGKDTASAGGTEEESTLMPIPRTAAVRLSPCQLASTNIPASFLPPTSTSLGHLIAAGSLYSS